MNQRKKSWDSFTPGQRKAIVVGAAVEVVLTTATLADPARRPRNQVRGHKALWAWG